MTTSPKRSVGHRKSCTYARNIAPSMGPSATIGAVTVVLRKAAMKVVTFQCPCGADATQRAPREERPRVRVMLVVAQVSSRKTSLAASQADCTRCHSLRACCTSVRSCSLACRVFFKAQPPIVQLMPQCGYFDLDPLISQSFAHFRQRQIGLFLDPRA